MVVYTVQHPIVSGVSAVPIAGCVKLVPSTCISGNDSPQVLRSSIRFFTHLIKFYHNIKKKNHFFRLQLTLSPFILPQLAVMYFDCPTSMMSAV